MADVSKEQLKTLSEVLDQAISDSESKEIVASIIGLMGLSDEDFDILAPGVLSSYEQVMNSPNNKLSIIQALNSSGVYAEDYVAQFKEFIAEIDNSSLPRNKREFLKQLIGVSVNVVETTEGIAKRIVAVPIELCHPDAKIPQYAHESDSGMDVYALEDITIHPGETKLVKTGIKVALPRGYELQVRPKSGRALKTKLRVANTPGTIDQGYRDEICVIIENVEAPIKDITTNTIMKENGFIDHMEITSIEYGSDFFIGKGEKFCQLVLAETPKVSFYTIDSVATIGDNRLGGFGSSSIYAKEDSRYGTDIT